MSSSRQEYEAPPVESHLYDNGLILSELERRFYLYLIGGDYERMFYTFADEGDGKPIKMGEKLMQRIRLDVEVSASERRTLQAKLSLHPEYQAMLDKLLEKRIRARLEHSGDLINASPEILDVIPIVKKFGGDRHFSDEMLSQINDIPWIKEQLLAFINIPEIYDSLMLTRSTDINVQLRDIGFPMFIWLLPRFYCEHIDDSIHPSLLNVFNKIREFARLVAGAIVTIALSERLPVQTTWRLYTLAAINCVPIVLLVVIINKEMTQMLEEQKKMFPDAKSPQGLVLENYEYDADSLRDVLVTEEFIKPHIIETLAFEDFDPFAYLFPVDQTDRRMNIFNQARAYAFYRQLYKTGRIHPHEAGALLKNYSISKATLDRLNRSDLSSMMTHLRLHDRVVALMSK